MHFTCSEPFHMFLLQIQWYPNHALFVCYKFQLCCDAHFYCTVSAGAFQPAFCSFSFVFVELCLFKMRCYVFPTALYFWAVYKFFSQFSISSLPIAVGYFYSEPVPFFPVCLTFFVCCMLFSLYYFSSFSLFTFLFCLLFGSCFALV